MSYPNSWQPKKLGDVCEFKYGKSLPDKIRDGIGNPVFGSNGVVGLHSEVLSSGETIIVGRKGSFGEVNYSSDSCWPIDTTYYVNPKFTSVDLRWLYYVLRSLGLNKLNRAAAIPGLNREDAYQKDILVPPKSEQKRIAAILDQAESLRAKRRAALEQLDALAQAIFIEMFGDPVSNPYAWSRVPFSELLLEIESGKSPVCLDRPAKEGEWGVLKLGAISQCEYRSTESKALENLSAVNERLEVKAGDVLFSRKNTYDLVAACVLVEETPEKLLLPDLIFRFKLRESAGVLPVYLQKLLVHPSKRREVQSLAGGAAGSMPNISKEKLLKHLIEVPPMPLQEVFAARMQRLREQKKSALRQLEVLDSLFASLQHRAFRGEL